MSGRKRTACFRPGQNRRGSVSRWWGVSCPCLLSHQVPPASRAALTTEVFPLAGVVGGFAVGQGSSPVVVGVSDSGTTATLAVLSPSAFYQWRARVAVSHVHARTPRDYAPRTRDTVRRRGTAARSRGKRTRSPGCPEHGPGASTRSASKESRWSRLERRGGVSSGRSSRSLGRQLAWRFGQPRICVAARSFADLFASEGQGDGRKGEKETALEG